MPADVFQLAEADAMIGINPDHRVLLRFGTALDNPGSL